MVTVFTGGALRAAHSMGNFRDDRHSTEVRSLKRQERP